ncbi:MAG: response regulator [Betaproteobacteria bacterium]|nr:response regulator [Betaproteobacteria bacterium]
MSERQRIFCVDDDVVSDVIIESIVGDEYEIEVFTSAEGCLGRLETQLPDIFLLNIGLPDMDGFSLCRELKQRADTAAIPIIFISRNELAEVRLAGYEAGGDDFILKPYVIDEVRHRLKHIRQAIEGREAMRNQLADSEQLSSLLLSNMDEYAALITFMRILNESTDADAVAQAVLGMLHGFRLQGAVQIRLLEQTFTLGDAGRDNPMETATIAHVATLDRIFQFKRCSAYNFDHLTVLVNNMPIEDADLCGRLRDHLSIAAEMADARIYAMVTDQRFRVTQNGIGEMLPDIQQTIRGYIERSGLARREAAAQVQELMDHLVISFTPLGLSQELEEEITAMVLEKAQRILKVFNHADETTATLGGLEQRLRSMLEG